MSKVSDAVVNQSIFHPNPVDTLESYHQTLYRNFHYLLSYVFRSKEGHVRTAYLDTFFRKYEDDQSGSVRDKHWYFIRRTALHYYFQRMFYQYNTKFDKHITKYSGKFFWELNKCLYDFKTRINQIGRDYYKYNAQADSDVEEYYRQIFFHFNNLIDHLTRFKRDLDSQYITFKNIQPRHFTSTGYYHMPPPAPLPEYRRPVFVPYHGIQYEYSYTDFDKPHDH